MIQQKIQGLKSQLVEMVEAASKERRLLITVKNAAVKCQQFELAANIRELETTLFPESKRTKAIKENAKRFQTTLAMVEVSASEKISYLIQEAVKGHSKKGGKFSIKDASKIIVNARNLYPAE